VFLNANGVAKQRKSAMGRVSVSSVVFKRTDPGAVVVDADLVL